MSRIVVMLPDDVPEALWPTKAEAMARDAVAAAGEEWPAAEVFVYLPAPGRCMFKAAGAADIKGH